MLEMHVQALCVEGTVGVSGSVLILGGCWWCVVLCLFLAGPCSIFLCSWRFAKLKQKTMPKSIPKSNKWSLRFFLNLENRLCDAKVVPKSCWGEILESKLGKEAPAYHASLMFWRHLVDWGCHFWPSWVPKGLENQPFWHNNKQM